MSYEHKPNSGTVFPNSRKTSDQHPTHTGKTRTSVTRAYASAVAQIEGR